MGFDLIATDGCVYLRDPRGDGWPWTDAADAGAIGEFHSFAPTDLEGLTAAGVVFRPLGAEPIADAPTIYWRADVDFAALLDLDKEDAGGVLDGVTMVAGIDL